MTKNRILFFSQFFPPQLCGSSVLMGSLLSAFPPDSAHVIRGMAGMPKIDNNFRVDVPQTVVEFPNWLGPFKYRLTFFLYPQMMMRALQLHRQYSFNGVFACWPSTSYIEFGYRFHKLTSIPLYIYMHDMWADNEPTKWRRKIASLIEGRILRAAKTVFAITEDAAEHFSKKYNVKTAVLEHSVDWERVEKPDYFSELKPDRSRYKIVFSGVIYSLMNRDSVLRVNNAVQEIPEAEMFLYTPVMDRHQIKGLYGDRLTIRSLSKDNLRQQLQQSDIVCMPLSFDTHATLEIKTVFSTKLLDYFVCGRPILVHAPHDSFLARDARTKGWGYVVDVPDKIAVKKAIISILKDVSMQRKLVAAAWLEARRRNSKLISEKFQRNLGIHSSWAKVER